MTPPSLTIEYCTSWGYLPRAAGLAAELERELGVRPTLVRGRGGIFEVHHGQELVFSKREAGRFPLPGEVARMLRERPEAE